MENQELTNQIKVQRAIKNITQEELAAHFEVTSIETAKFVSLTILTY